MAAIGEEARATFGGEVVHERGLHGEAVLERRGRRALLRVAARQLERVRDDLGVLFRRGVTRRGAPREAGCQAERMYGQRVQMIRQLELRLAGICSLGITEGDGVVRSSETIPRGCANGCWRARHVVASKGSVLSSARER